MMASSNKIAKESSEHVCNHCGSCCLKFPYVRLSHDDVKALEDFTGLAPEEFSDSSDVAGKNRFLTFQDDGGCIFLKAIDGHYSCSVYEARSMTCRSCPATDVQNETCRVSSNR